MQVEAIKVQILGAVASLDRGLAANVSQGGTAHAVVLHPAFFTIPFITTGGGWVGLYLHLAPPCGAVPLFKTAMLHMPCGCCSAVWACQRGSKQCTHNCLRCCVRLVLLLLLGLQVREARDVDRLARKLEDAAGAVTLKWTTSRSSPNKSTMDKLVSCGSFTRVARAQSPIQTCPA
jgi:hypothetical protein